MKGCRDNLVYVSDLEEIKHDIQGILPLKQIVFELEADYEFVTSVGNKLIFRTNKGAPNYRLDFFNQNFDSKFFGRLVEIDLSKPEPEHWRTLVPEHPKDVLDWASAADKDKLILCYIRDVKNVLQCNSLVDGSLQFDFPLDVGTICGFHSDEKHSEIFYQFTSFLTPGVIWRCNLRNNPPQPEVTC